MEAKHVLILLLVFSGCADAYLPYMNEQGAHPWINKAAVEKFKESVMPYDPNLKSASLDGQRCFGGAWPETQRAMSEIQPSVPRFDTLENWIMHGGFSADEPEGLQALRHFYDPMSKKAPWLTDQVFITNHLRLLSKTAHGNPEISAKDWAFEGATYQSSEKMDVLPQDYSFEDAKRYYAQALASKERSDPGYGNAWRAVGETMHLMADMALPAHVRNDGHADGDPYEDSTLKAEIQRYADGTPSTSVDYYNKDIRVVFDSLATWTNNNFLSRDTIPNGLKDKEGNPVTSNGKPEYASPAMSVPGKDGYVWWTVDGEKVRIARKSMMSRVLSFGSPTYILDKRVMDDQRRLLVPTAIRASASVLDAFLPRFNVEAEVKQPDKEKRKYMLYGKIVHLATKEWPQQELPISNGAQLVLTDDSGKVVKSMNIKPSSGTVNRVEYGFEAEEGLKARLEYDLGGYVVRSDDLELGDVDLGKCVYRVNVSWEPGAYSEWECKDHSRPYDKHGWMKSVNSKGVTTYYAEYNNNILNGLERRWSEDGKLVTEGTYKNGTYEGLFRTWYPNGKLSLETTYSNKAQDYDSIAYWDNGGVREEYHYRNGKLNGHSKFYKKNGQLKYEALYKDGAIVSGTAKEWYTNPNNGEAKSWGWDGKLQYHWET